jgi:hypothetical protein
MTDRQKTALRKFAGKVKPILGKGLTVEASEDGLSLTIKVHYIDAGNEWMTYADVAAYCNVDVKTVRYWTRARTKAAARFPFPETKELAGPRVRRNELVAWWNKMQEK